MVYTIDEVYVSSRKTRVYGAGCMVRVQGVECRVQGAEVQGRWRRRHGHVAVAIAITIRVD